MKIKLTLTSKSRSARISPQFASLGEVAEWSNVAVLKTVVAKATVGSNPTLSVFAPVAQWIRASDYGSEGRGFESLPALL